jgi:hypothetical protein
LYTIGQKKVFRLEGGSPTFKQKNRFTSDQCCALVVSYTSASIFFWVKQQICRVVTGLLPTMAFDFHKITPKQNNLLRHTFDRAAIAQTELCSVE